MSAPSVPEVNAPFTDAAATKAAYQAVYNAITSDPATGMGQFTRFWGLSSVEELMGTPARINSGSLTTFSSWLGLFPFVPADAQTVDIDEIGLADDGYKLFFFGRWNGKCVGVSKLPDGTTLDLTGKEFKGLRYAYVLTFDRETKKAVLFEGLYDLSEWGRLMGSTTFALAAAAQSLYPA